MTTLLKRLLPPRLKWILARWLHNDLQATSTISHAQEGEDIALLRRIGHRPNGFFVDVGAHHPSRFSNTLAFSNMGWRGINIEANPDAAGEFLKKRHRDINLNIGIGGHRSQMKFFRFDEPALNTFSPEVAEQREKSGFKMLDSIPIEVYPLAEVLEKHLPAGTAIDLLSVDVEGLDLDVLQSNDWERFAPAFIIVEILDRGLDEVKEDPIAIFLKSKGYMAFAKTGHSVIFERAIATGSHGN
ncbi:MAG: FkbM family methyltransferase [Luteolibacter sp.]